MLKSAQIVRIKRNVFVFLSEFRHTKPRYPFTSERIHIAVIGARYFEGMGISESFFVNKTKERTIQNAPDSNTATCRR